MSASSDRTELAHLEEEWMSAMQARDMDRLEQLVATGFRFTAIHLNSEPMSREQWMGAAREGSTTPSFAFENREIAVSGDTAVTPSRSSRVASGESNNLPNFFPPTDVGAGGVNGWQVVARHSSIL